MSKSLEPTLASAATSHAAGPADELPTYGPLYASLADAVASTLVPPGFMVGGQPGTPGQWEAFLQGLVNECADELWPRFDTTSGQWMGIAKSQMLPLTAADLALFNNKLAARLGQPAGSGPLANATHKELFGMEDEMATKPLFATADRYVHMLSPSQQLRLREEMGTGLRMMGPPPLRFKVEHQRPRPYQASFILGSPIRFELARSSMTPALPSGHCLQGVFVACSAFLALRGVLQGLPGAVTGLQQYAVDFGDRRVFAGVHYPSDNLYSWFLALRLCDHMFAAQGQAAKDFAVVAIKGSSVFDAMAVDAATDPASPFIRPLAWLRGEMARPVLAP